MLFNSFDFLIFFPVVCIIYFLLPNNRYKNPFLLIVSYYFYMNWEPIYAVLIFLSTVLTYTCGILVEKNKIKNRKKIFLTFSLLINFSILFIFKYYNFINESVFNLLSVAGIRLNLPSFDFLLPVGISFYTFQAVGYTIDVYRGNIKAEKNFLIYALFISFFPQLVAGPIERAKNLLPQFHIEHKFNPENVAKGLKQMIWGFFMKLCVADVLSNYVDAVYNNISHHNGFSIFIATIFFTFQIYCDFAGYSNIAIGTARVMGFKLMNNFKQPYFSISIKEFWRRWHISLSTWFSDYVYIPLGGNRVKYSRHLLNLLITFLISGIWHGANWTFVLWGLLHGMYIIVENIIRKYIYAYNSENVLTHFFYTIFTFTLVSFAWIFFRANNVNDCFIIIKKIFFDWDIPFVDSTVFFYGLIALLILFIKDFKDCFNININFMHSRNHTISYISMLSLIVYILLFGALSAGSFIYFQF